MNNKDWKHSYIVRCKTVCRMYAFSDCGWSSKSAVKLIQSFTSDVFLLTVNHSIQLLVFVN